MIRHQHLCPLPAGALPVAMIEPAFGAPLVAAVGGTALAAAGLGAAIAATIALSAVAVLADPEHRVTAAAAAAADPLPQNDFVVASYAPSRAGLDNGNISWQVRTSFDAWPPDEGCQAGTPPLETAGFLFRFRLRRQHTPL